MKTIIVTKWTVIGPDYGGSDIRIFETDSAPENLAENYRNWLVRWAKSRGEDTIGNDGRYGDFFEIVGMWQGESISKAPAYSGIKRAVGMMDAEYRRKEEEEQRREAVERQDSQRQEYQRLHAIFGNEATQGEQS